MGGESLFKIINGLRHFGVGSKVTREIYKFPETYWVVTRVKLSKDQNHGKVYGRMIWRGRPKSKDEKIGATLKDQWKLVSLPNYKEFTGKQEEINSLIPTNTDRTV